MSMWSYYIKAALFPAIIAIVSSTVFAAIQNRNYKSEWLSADAVVGLIFLAVLIHSILMSMLSLPILLVRIKSIWRNRLHVSLCWFLLPFIYMAVQITHEIYFNLTYDEKLLNEEIVYILIANLPFITGLIFTNRKYRQENPV